MSREVLIQDLRAKGEEQIAALWRETREEAARFRAEAEQGLAGEQDRCDLAGRRAERGLQRRRATAARRRAEELITRAEQELNKRMYNLARELLAGRWSEDRAPLLPRLAAELPPGDWGKIRVNPADHAAAKKLFPEAEIDPDSQILGGLVATSRDGRIIVDNTWTTRLRRAWSQLAPKLLQEVAPNAEAG